MRTSTVEIRDVFLHPPVEMPLAGQDEVIEALPPQAALEPLADAVGLRSPDRRQQNVDVRPLDHPLRRLSVLPISISDEKARLLTKGSSLTKLLGYSFIRWMTRHREVNNTARSQLDDDKHIQGAEEEVVCLKEVGGPNL